MKILSFEETQLFMTLVPSPHCKFIAESNFQGSSPLFPGAFRDTGRFHFLMEFACPEKLLDLGDSDKSVWLTWELEEEIKINDDVYLVFTAWGDPPNPSNNFIDNSKYADKKFGILTGEMYRLFSYLNKLSPDINYKLLNTIGLERLQPIFQHNIR
jgi:hypothetical protein